MKISRKPRAKVSRPTREHPGQVFGLHIVARASLKVTRTKYQVSKDGTLVTWNLLPVTSRFARTASIPPSPESAMDSNWLCSSPVETGKNGTSDSCVTAAQLWPVLTAFLAERDKIKERRDSQSAHQRSATAELVHELALPHHKLRRAISMHGPSIQ